ncbi:inner membrane-spanning protein YciB [Idiomarina sp. HP20-50]|uniref:inner membrane-spanning protein YciB n=1 Tax=Idiomarina sp. HP20-50 TaxID=3070813 RepID=UPI00294B62AA|nr:inner membrane-spanning protein YciB [Idiomarina sp. HP20-50]MDV6317056.1 inner membrane-spanning protein YciB [Idiomarina sp. HP20-50]
MALLLEYLPIIAFFVFYKMADIYVATGVLMAGTVLQVIGLKLLKHPLTARHWILPAVVLVFGSITLLLHDDWFIKMKVSVIYIALALFLLGSILLKKRNPIKSLRGKDIELPDIIWLRLTYAWIIYCVALATVNLYIAEFWSQEAWVNFKVFGILIATFIFILCTELYINKFAEDKENTD